MHPNARRDPNRPSVPDVLPMVRALYAEPDCGAGCCMHVQLDDGNVEDRFFDADSRAWVEQCGNPAHLVLFDLLAKMTPTQRRKVARIR